MFSDPVVEDVRKRRREILESHGWDFRRMSEDAMNRQKRSNRLVANPPGKKTLPGMAPNAYSLREQGPGKNAYNAGNGRKKKHDSVARGKKSPQ